MKEKTIPLTRRPPPPEKKISVLQSVEPVSVLHFFSPSITSLACESQVAKIRNRTVLGMQQNDVLAVACRYLQNKQGEKNTYREIFLSGAAALGLFLYLLKYVMESDQIPLLTSAFVITTIALQMLNTTANVGNTARYKETKEGCKEWLVAKTSEKTFQRLDDLPYNNTTFFHVKKLLPDLKTRPDLLPARFSTASVETVARNNY